MQKRFNQGTRNMAWVTRGRRRYYYQSVRVGGRVTRRYLGAGPAAERAAAELERLRRNRALQATLLVDEERRHTAAVVPLDELCRLTDLLLRATLGSLGYHRHARGAWRRRRHVPDHDPVARRERVP